MSTIIYVIHAETSNGDEVFGATLSLEKAEEKIDNLAKDTEYET